jgi:hypothetical protein
MKRNTWEYWINWDREDYILGDYDALVDFLYNYDHLDLTSEQHIKYDYLCSMLDDLYDNDLNLGYDDFIRWANDDNILKMHERKELGTWMHRILECNTMFKQYDKGEANGNKLN